MDPPLTGDISGASLTESGLSDDPGEPEEQHHTPDVEQTSHLTATRRSRTVRRAAVYGHRQ